MVGLSMATLFSFGITKVAGRSSSAVPGSTPAQPTSPPAPAGSAKTSPAPGGKQRLSSSSEAVRKRRERALKSRLKKAKAARRDRTASDAEKAQAREAAAAAASTTDAEKETHYTDGSGRKRKRKHVRTRALDSGVTTAASRKWTDTERELVVAQHAKMAQVTHKPSWGSIALELHKLHPTIFGPGSPGKPLGILRQDVRAIVQRHQKAQIADGRGRPSALPEFAMVMMMAAMTSIVTARSSIISAPLLQPVAFGAVIAAGCSSFLQSARREHRDRARARSFAVCSVAASHTSSSPSESRDGGA